MMKSLDPQHYVSAIRARNLSIYDPIMVGHPDYWIPTPALESLLDMGLRGLNLAGLPLRTRSKLVKTRICELLGYPVPPSFMKTHPRFPGQMFDVIVQGSRNFQPVNKDISPAQRYVFVEVSNQGYVTNVRAVDGDRLIEFKTTDTKTYKFQALCKIGAWHRELHTKFDTQRLMPFVSPDIDLSSILMPLEYPVAGQLLTIRAIYDRLCPLVGRSFPNPGGNQERIRGAALHRLVSEALGYRIYLDNGQFPDIPHQLLEVKLQTSSTIDLGLFTPDSVEPLRLPMILSAEIRHCDVRYAIFYASIENGLVTLTHFFLTTGEAFFSSFPKCGGNVQNSKFQIKLPKDFFNP